MTTIDPYTTCANCRQPVGYHADENNPHGGAGWITADGGICPAVRSGAHDPILTIEAAGEALRAVERGDLPSGSYIVKVTGPNSLSSPSGQPPSAELLAVRTAAEEMRAMRAQYDALADLYAAALKAALEHHTRDQVAEAAGVSFQAMYDALRVRNGPRRTRKAPAQPATGS